MHGTSGWPRQFTFTDIVSFVQDQESSSREAHAVPEVRLLVVQSRSQDHMS